MRYPRALSPAFEETLLSGGPLQFFVSEYRSWIADDGHALDLHLRVGDQLMYYHGLTRPLVVTWIGNGRIRCSANPAFANFTLYSEVMRVWERTELGRLRELLSGYFEQAKGIGDQYYANQEEGFWQNVLSLKFGTDWRPGTDWLVIDREAVVSYENSAARDASEAPVFSKYRDFKQQLQEADPGRYGQPNGTGFGGELDFLAIGPAGELYCIEVKTGNNAAGIYWAPLQVAGYREIWMKAVARNEFREDLRRLVNQKVRLGLLPEDAARRVPEDEYRSVISQVVVASPNDRSTCWQSARQVISTFPETATAFVDVRSVEDPAPIVRLL